VSNIAKELAAAKSEAEVKQIAEKYRKALEANNGNHDKIQNGCRNHVRWRT
jgi:hypothetical protein